jgi:hypothetical protein
MRSLRNAEDLLANEALTQVLTYHGQRQYARHLVNLTSVDTVAGLPISIG